MDKLFSEIPHSNNRSDNTVRNEILIPLLIKFFLIYLSNFDST